MLRPFLVLVLVAFVQFDFVESSGPGKCQHLTKSLEDEYFYSDYRGCVNTGPNGEKCANWMEIGDFWGDDEYIDENQAQENGIGDHNYCRNPGNKRYGPWCYQKYKGRKKVYCVVNQTNCFSDRNYDVTCTDRRAPKEMTVRPPKEMTVRPQPRPMPQRARVDVTKGEELVLRCNTQCSDDTVLWTSGPGLLKATTEDPLKVEHVTMASSGDWECSCGGRDYIWTVNVCQVHWTECRNTSEGWVKQATGCSTSDVIRSSPCNPALEPTPGTPDTNSVNPAARMDPGQEGSTGPCVDCGFCLTFPGICGAMGCLGGAMVLIAAIFVYKTQKWREYKLQQAGTLPPYRPQELTYETALQLQQMIDSRSTTLTDTLNLRNLRADGKIGRIVSRDLESLDDLVCESYNSADSEFISHFGDTVPNPGFPQHLEQDRRDHTIFDKYYDQNVDSWSVGSVAQI